MNRKLTDNWTTITDCAESDHGAPIYVATVCGHGQGVAHSLTEALACGLLRDVRRARGMTQVQVAQALGVAPSVVPRWERGETTPVGLYRQALEGWLLSATPDR